jgi:hypothetical protein
LHQTTLTATQAEVENGSDPTGVALAEAATPVVEQHNAELNAAAGGNGGPSAVPGAPGARQGPRTRAGPRCRWRWPAWRSSSAAWWPAGGPAPRHDLLGPPLRMVTSDGAASAERRVYGAGGLTMLAGFACPAVAPLTGHDSGAPVGGLRPDAEAVASAPGPAAVANEADADVTVSSGRPGLRAPDAVTAPPLSPGRRRPAPDLPDVPRPSRHRTGGAGGCPPPAVNCSFPTISATSAGGTAAR